MYHGGVCVVWLCSGFDIEFVIYFYGNIHTHSDLLYEKWDRYGRRFFHVHVLLYLAATVLATCSAVLGRATPAEYDGDTCSYPTPSATHACSCMLIHVLMAMALLLYFSLKNWTL